MGKDIWQDFWGLTVSLDLNNGDMVKFTWQIFIKFYIYDVRTFF